MYRTIDAAFWTDPKVKALKPTSRYLFLYLITNPRTHVSGIYVLRQQIIAIETALSAKDLGYGIDTLSSSGFCSFDTKTEVVWVHNMFAYQGSGEKNLRSAALHLTQDLHKSNLVTKFCDRYPAVKQYLPDGFLDRVSIGYSVGATPDTRSLIPDTRIQNTDSEKIPYGHFHNVWLSEIEHRELQSRFNGNLEMKIETLSEYMESKGKKYKSHYATILTWDRKNTNGQTAYKTRTDRTLEAAQRLRARLDHEDGERHECGTQRSDAVDLSGKNGSRG